MSKKKKVKKKPKNNKKDTTLKINSTFIDIVKMSVNQKSKEKE